MLDNPVVQYGHIDSALNSCILLQVGLVTFSSSAKVEIPLYRGITKCEFLTQLDKVPYEGGATNIGAGMLWYESLVP